MSVTSPGFIDNLIVAARENPISAALIGGGALWLMMGNRRLSDATRQAASGAANAIGRSADILPELKRTVAPPTASDLDKDSGSGVGESFRAASDAASRSMADVTDNVRHHLDQGADFAREQFDRLGNALPGTETLAKARSSLGDVLDRQPLVLGAIGAVIGAAVAGALRTSQVENEHIGEFSDYVKDDLSRRGSAVSKAIREASDTLLAEAGDMGAEAADRVKQAGMDAAQAAKEKMQKT